MFKKEENKKIIQINLVDCLNASSIMDHFLEVIFFGISKRTIKDYCHFWPLNI